MFGSWLSYSHDRRWLHRFRLSRWSCSHYSNRQCGCTFTNAGHLHKPVYFTDIRTRCIDDGYFDGVIQVAPEIPFTPEENRDILIGSVRVDYLLIDSI